MKLKKESRRQMFLAVILKDSLELLVIPTGWCYNFDVVRKVNHGLKTWKTEIIFYSPNNNYPNFLLPIQSEFNDDEDACYKANILKTFYEKKDADDYVEVRRNNSPVNYTENNAQEPFEIPVRVSASSDEDEDERNVEVKPEPVHLGDISIDLTDNGDYNTE